MEDVANYQSMYGIQLPIATLVSAKIRENIISRNYYLGVNDSTFYSLKAVELMQYLQQATKPTDKVMFQSALKAYVEFDIHPTYKPTASYFKPLYEAILAYRTKFLNVYTFMAENNSANTPRLDTKEGGIIKIFLSKIPFGYGASLYSSLKVPKHGWETLELFLNDFYKVVQAHFKISQQSYALSNHFDSNNKLGYEVFSKDDQGVQNNKYNNKLGAKSTKLNYIENDNNIQEDLSLDEEYIQDSNEPHIGIKKYENTLEKKDAEYDIDADNDTDIEPDIIKLEVNNVTNMNTNKASNTNTVPGGCFMMLLHGECKRKDKCTYSHDVNVLNKSCTAYVNTLMKSKYYHDTKGSESAISVARRPPGYNSSK
jgi:hypothetical protein